jgi:hypothetical protein
VIAVVHAEVVAVILHRIPEVIHCAGKPLSCIPRGWYKGVVDVYRRSDSIGVPSVVVVPVAALYPLSGRFPNLP